MNPSAPDRMTAAPTRAAVPLRLRFRIGRWPGAPAGFDDEPDEGRPTEKRSAFEEAERLFFCAVFRVQSANSGVDR